MNYLPFLGEAHYTGQSAMKKKRPNINWNPGMVPLSKKGRFGSVSTPKTSEDYLNSLLPHLVPGALFTIDKLCTGSVLDVEGRQVLVILGPEFLNYAPVTSPAIQLHEGTSALFLGESKLTYSNKGQIVNRVVHDFLIMGRKWTITDLQWIRPASLSSSESESELDP